MCVIVNVKSVLVCLQSAVVCFTVCFLVAF